ncbi:neuroblastoma breakpoint family member 4 isoform X2 [Gorilla gorilla gorilla]|uniref:neuroblastoma breakpoint family member 4 isoform X2 n=1 Tax=Gorilla gorilla gorilla TaxID=9595 RepID=UPI003008D13C
MVVSADPLSSERAEMNILEINQELCSQLAESNQQFRDLKEKFLITQATAYSLANQLKKYKCEEYKDIIDSMLRDELQSMEKLAEKLRQAEELRQYKALVHSQAKELTQLREKLREGRDASRWLNKHLKTLLTPDDPDKSQGQDLREQLAEGHRLAEHLVHKLSPENDEDEDEDEDDKDEEVEKVQESPAPREVQKTEEKEVPQDSLEECAVTSSNIYNPSNSNQPHRSTKITFEEHEVDSALVVESEHPHDEEEEALNILPENQNDHEEEEGKAPVPPRNRQSLEPGELTNLRDFLISPVVSHVANPGHHDKSNSYRHREVSFLALNEQKVCSAQDVARDYSNPKWDETPLGFLERQNDLEEVKGQETVAPRLSRGPLRVDKHEIPQESLDGCCLTPSILPDLTPSYHPYWSTLYSFEDKQVSLALVDKIKKDQEEIEDQSPPCPRLSQELPEVKEQEVPEDSVNEVYLTPSVHHDVSDCHQPYSSTLSSLEDQLACSALDVASPTEAACPQGTWSGDLSHHRSEVQVSQAQLEPSTLVPICLRLQLDQGFHCGNGLPQRGLSSTTCSLSANADSGNQWPFQELVLEPSLGMKNPPQLEDDALEGSASNTQGRQVTGRIRASLVLILKTIRRRLPFSKWRLAFRFAGPHAGSAEIPNTAGRTQRMIG